MQKSRAQPVLPNPGFPRPQVTDGELRSLMTENQPFKDRDDIFLDAMAERQRQNAHNGR